MDDSGHIKLMEDLTEEEKKTFHQIADEHQAQAGMLLHGEKETRVDPQLFKVWTKRKQRNHVKRKMAKQSRKQNR